MEGLEALIQAGRVDEVEQLLSTLVDSEPAKELSADISPLFQRSST